MGNPLDALPSLTLLTGPESGRRIPLTTGRTAVVGRSLESDLTFPDEPSLSRFHARIDQLDDGAFSITDLGSVNGTHVNGRPVTETTVLNHRDVITCGALELRFELPEGRRSAGSSTASLALPETQGAVPRIRSIIAPESRPPYRPQPEARPGSTAPYPMREPEPPPADEDVPAESLPPAVTAAQASVPESVPLDETPSPVVAAAPAPVHAQAAGAPAEGEPLVAGALEQALAAVPLFQRLGLPELKAVTRNMTERSFPAGTEIVRQGQEGLSLYIVLAGQVNVQRAGASDGSVELGTIGPGGFFGEMTLLDGLPRSATVRAATDVRCALLPRWGLEDVIRTNPAVAMEMLAVLSQRLRNVEGLLTA